MRVRRSGLVASLLLTVFFAACASRHAHDGAPRAASAARLPGDAIPRREARSRYGNGPYYKVNGNTYRVLDSSYGYKARGVASWYGRKFHGRRTSSQEPYDMYAMTAAHRTLPLPTYVRVRNLRNNKSVVVRVNDRGPFVDNRLIDLSYSAALKLDMVRTGTSLVEVTALSFDEPPPQTHQTVKMRKIKPKDMETHANIYVQAGAFSEVDNAKRRFALLRSGGIVSVVVHEDKTRSPKLYRIRIGPVVNVIQYDSIIEELQKLGITETHLVTE